MNRDFADAYYFFGLLNPRDAAHKACVNFSDQRTPALLSTAWVFTELADGIGRSGNRHLIQKFLFAFENEESNLLIPATDDLFRRGMELFDSRPDKQWSLTDCISFIVMQDQNVTEALTADRHFEQAGFVPLLG